MNEKKDDGAALLPADPSASLSTEALPTLTTQAAAFIAVSFRGRIADLARAAKARTTYEGDYAPAVRYYAAACDAARAVLQQRLDALSRIGSGTGPQQEHADGTRRSAAP